MPTWAQQIKGVVIDHKSKETLIGAVVTMDGTNVKADDGILLHLSTEEYEHLFDWKRVCKEVTVVQPLFYVRQKDGRLKMQAVWAKSCRGAMVRFILNNRLVTPKELSAFNYEGFEFAPLLGDANNPHFVREFIK